MIYVLVAEIGVLWACAIIDAQRGRPMTAMLEAMLALPAIALLP